MTSGRSGALGYGGWVAMATETTAMSSVTNAYLTQRLLKRVVIRAYCARPRAMKTDIRSR